MTGHVSIDAGARISRDDTRAEEDDELNTLPDVRVDALDPAAARRGRISQTFRSLRHRGFRLYLFGLMLSLIGTYTQMVAEGWLVYQLSNSAFTLGLVGFIAMVPLVPWSLVAGALADRMSRKTLLAITQVGQIFPPIVLGILTWTGLVEVWHVVVVNLIMGALSTVDQPTRQALVVDVVEPEDRENALALTSSGFNLARVIGPVLAGILIGSIGLAGAFVVNGLSFLAVLIALAMLRIPDREMPARQRSLKSNLVEGGRYLVGERTILALITLMVIVSLFVLPYQTLLPVFARDVLDVGPAGYGFLSAAAGVGAILGALMVANVSRRRRRGLIVALVLGIPVAAAAFGFSRSLVLSSLALTLVSGGIVALKTLGFTLVQIQTRDELRGRTTSILLLMMGATPRVGGLLLGFLAGRLGAPLALGLGALGCLVGGLLGLALFAPRLRQLE